MSKVHSRRKPHGERQQSTVELPILLSQDDVRQSRTDYRTLYVLGFGIVGTFLGNMTVLIYFVSLNPDGVKIRRW
jgi:hypothetical protein